MREDGVKQFLEKANVNWKAIEKLIHKGKLIEVKYKDKKFYARKLLGNKKVE